MGGRKSYFVDDVVGKRPKDKRKFLSDIKSGSPSEISQTTIGMFVKSDKVVDDLANVFETLKFIDENFDKKPLNYEDRKKLASKFWAEQKKKKKIDTSSQFNRILVDSLTKVIRRGGKDEK